MEAGEGPRRRGLNGSRCAWTPGRAEAGARNGRAAQARATGTGRVSRPTVYRTLSELVDAGLLRKMDLGGRAVYEHDYGYPQHDHLYCTQCHELFEFRSDQLLQLRDAVAQEHKFRVAGHRFIITGVCEACQRARRRPKRRIPVI